MSEQIKENLAKAGIEVKVFNREEICFIYVINQGEK